MLLRGCTQYVSKFGKLRSGHRTVKSPFSFQSQIKAMPENVQTIIHLHSFHMLAKLCLKILQTRLQQYMNRELPDSQAGFRKGRGTKNQIANILWIIEKAREFQKIIYLVDQNKVIWITSNWKILKEMGMPDHLTCLLRNLCVGQEAIVRTRCRKTDGFQIEKRERQGCILSPWSFNLYTSTLCKNARLAKS